ncbi:MAG: MBL fold metallo-hydrolase [Chitinophagaceae bacterium]|nr:MBL fold metallo-hydrolase [Chitinophagaceae bacterium]
MALFISSINSGSNGNCYYIGNTKEAVLIDAGVSCRTIERRMKELDLNIGKLKAVFISHEHTDHIRGVETLSRKYRLPVYISELTYRASGLNIDGNHLRHFSDKDIISVGDINVHAFSKVHDARDPFSFAIKDYEVQVGVFTDIGTCSDDLIHWFKGCHAAFLEANYDEEMLQNGPYPYYLKKRISNGEGHLSNTLAHRLFCEHRPDYMSHLILSHLSEQNNSPEIVEELFNSNCGNVSVTVASRHEASPVFEITTGKKKIVTPASYKQLKMNF